MSSGATNRQKQREAETRRRAEEQLAPRRLGHLPPAQAAEARRLMDQVLLGAIDDPDAAPDEDEEDAA
jgi:hypothetical protein